MPALLKKHFGLACELGKAKISSLATASMGAGYLLARGTVTIELPVLVLGVLLIACGSSAINHIQERDIDGRMRRTRGRPLPSRRITTAYARNFAVVSIGVGLSLIVFSSNLTAMLLGMTAVVWYNAVYTPLKRVTAFAAVPGGVVGALPPVIGWTAGGGGLADPGILAVAFFFFVWQVPHFWLLLLFSCGRDYEEAGVPSLTRLFSDQQIARITFVWIFTAAVACLFIPMFGAVENPWVSAGLLASGLWLVGRSAAILGVGGGSFAFRRAFRQINVYVCFVMALLSVSGIMS